MSEKQIKPTLVAYDGGMGQSRRFAHILRDVEDYGALPLMQYLKDEFARHVPHLEIMGVEVGTEKESRSPWHAYVIGKFPASPLCCEGEDLRTCLLSLMNALWQMDKRRGKTGCQLAPAAASVGKSGERT